MNVSPTSTDQQHLQALRDALASLGRVVVAFSGGTDSALVAHVAHQVLGADALAVTAVSPSLPADELAHVGDETRDEGTELGVARRGLVEAHRVHGVLEVGGIVREERDTPLVVVEAGGAGDELHDATRELAARRQLVHAALRQA